MRHRYTAVVDADSLAAAGLGLTYGEVALAKAREEWLALGAALAHSAHQAIDDRLVAIEHVGSTSVPGLLAKPILDLAVGVPAEPEAGMFENELSVVGWQYRGDAGEKGGLVFVLETRPMHRVAHLHVVRRDGPQWRNYLAFRDLLRSHAGARASYESTKRSLLADFPLDRKAYQAGKESTVEALIGGAVNS